jgi:polysaccharide biosynthesis protein PslG
MSKTLLKRAGLLFLLTILVSLFSPTMAFGAPTFPNDVFRQKWERADKAVDEGRTSRSWLWGPDAFSAPSGFTEPYTESPGGVRQVLYFDKARMELNNPANGFVSNGLLVKELIAGRLATGDAAFTQRRPADIPVAGDPDGSEGPVYASFISVSSWDNGNAASSKIGTAVTETLDRLGRVGSAPELGSFTKYVYFDSNLKHNIPEVFWNFLNQRGTVFQGGNFVNDQPILGDNPALPWLDATGYPMSEAYWG